MKITEIETHVCHARMRNWVFVKVLTDQAGLCGWGEATLEWHTRAVVGAVEDIAQLLVGEDPTRIEHLWQMMYRQHFWHGNGIVRGTAISGIDIALWDILGKVHGVPCHKLWGGPVRDYVRTYCHLGGGKMEDFYETTADDAATLRRAGAASGRGRLHRVQVDGRAGDDAARGAAARSATPSVRRGDARRGRRRRSTSWSTATPGRRPRMGLLFAKALEPYGLYWFEEPCWPESVDDIAEIQRSGGDADRHRRAAGRRPRLPRAAGEARLQRHPAGHHALRRADRGAADRRAGGGVSRRAGAAQPAGAGQHGRLAGVRVRHAELHHLRGGPRRRAVALRGRAARLRSTPRG